MTLAVDLVTGEIADGSCTIGPTLSRTSFLEMFPEAEEWVVNEPWRSWRIKRASWSIVVYFCGSRLTQADLVWIGAISDAIETAPDYEKRRHAFHRSLLRKWKRSLLPVTKVVEDWGEVRAFVDDRSSAFIRVTWLAEQTRPGSRPVPG